LSRGEDVAGKPGCWVEREGVEKFTADYFVV